MMLGFYVLVIHVKPCEFGWVNISEIEQSNLDIRVERRTIDGTTEVNYSY